MILGFNVLIRLLMAHFLADFSFQSKDWLEEKHGNKWRNKGMFYHILVLTLLTFLFQWDLSRWYVAAIIVLTHQGIDLWKSHRPNTLIFLLWDQAFHLLVILVLWLVFYSNYKEISETFFKTMSSPNLWILAFGYYLVVGPLGIIIGKTTFHWKMEADMDRDGLSKAGMWIGRCERVLVLTFILLGQYTALGFLMTAKSILRFGDSENRQQKKTEYILVGTLLSFSSAAVIGVLIKLILTPST